MAETPQSLFLLHPLTADGLGEAAGGEVKVAPISAACVTQRSINFSSKPTQGLKVSQGPQLESVCYKTVLPSAYRRQVAGVLDRIYAVDVTAKWQNYIYSTNCVIGSYVENVWSMKYLLNVYIRVTAQVSTPRCCPAWVHSHPASSLDAVRTAGSSVCSTWW